MMLEYINNAHQLESLLTKNKRVDFIFEFPRLSAVENNLWLQRIKANYFECGCSMGKKFMMYSLLLTFSGLLYIYFFKSETFLVTRSLYSVLFIVFMGGVGKAVGKSIAYKKLKNDLNDLKSILK